MHGINRIESVERVLCGYQPNYQLGLHLYNTLQNHEDCERVNRLFVGWIKAGCKITG